MKAVAYLRVSTEDQTVENQRLFIQRWAKENNYEVLIYFEDPAVSGKTPAIQREGFSRMMSTIKGNFVEAVLVYELSRVGRTFYDTLDAIKWVERYCPLISCSPKEAFLQSTDPSVRKLLISILSWVAEREREVLVTRIKAGLARCKAEGKHLGHPPAVVDMEKMKKLLDSPMHINDIAAELGISKVTLYRKIREIR